VPCDVVATILIMKTPYSIYKYADLMTIDDFIEAVKRGDFIDWDGSGNFCDGKTEDHERLSCEALYNGFEPDSKWTHVAWYNK